MSSIVISGDTSGSVTIAAPAVAGTNTITLPASTGTMLTTGNSGRCAAWVNFQGGAGNTAGTINGSYNVTSITVNGTGDYTVNITNALANANYAVAVTIKPSSSQTTINAKNGQVHYGTTPTTTAVRIMTSSTAVFENYETVFVSIFI